MMAPDNLYPLVNVSVLFAPNAQPAETCCGPFPLTALDLVRDQSKPPLLPALHLPSRTAVRVRQARPRECQRGRDRRANPDEMRKAAACQHLRAKRSFAPHQATAGIGFRRHRARFRGFSRLPVQSHALGQYGEPTGRRRSDLPRKSHARPCAGEAGGSSYRKRHRDPGGNQPPQNRRPHNVDRYRC